MNKRKMYIFALVLALGVTLFEELYLRSFLLKQHVVVFTIIAGSLPNFLAVQVLFYGACVIRFPLNYTTAAKALLGVMAGLILYECCQPLMSQRTFDVNDIIATVISGANCYLNFWFVEKMFEKIDASKSFLQ